MGREVSVMVGNVVASTSSITSSPTHNSLQRNTITEPPGEMNDTSNCSRDCSFTFFTTQRVSSRKIKFEFENESSSKQNFESCFSSSSIVSIARMRVLCCSFRSTIRSHGDVELKLWCY